jgi:hypothetical protein
MNDPSLSDHLSTAVIAFWAGTMWHDHLALAIVLLILAFLPVVLREVLTRALIKGGVNWCRRHRRENCPCGR